MTGSPADALFVPDGDSLVPTELARGPWSAESLHGGPVAAVVTRATERTMPADDGLRMVRLTLELLRPVGMAPLRVTGRLSRPGRKVQLVDTLVTQSGVGRGPWPGRADPGRRRGGSTGAHRAGGSASAAPSAGVADAFRAPPPTPPSTPPVWTSAT